jgi:aldose 1-epimerase
MLTLRSGDCSLVLAPEIGGAIVGWTHAGTPLLRRAAADAIIAGNVRGLACFPLVPFSNRIADGRFRWDGADYLLNRNFGDHPHTIHGVGWQRAWNLAAIGPASATLTLRHDATGDQEAAWPFAFSAEQRVTLAPDALHVALAVRNLHASAAPAGLGLHPYFSREGTPTLRFNATTVWSNATNALPSEALPVPPSWDHSQGLRIGSASLDNCFAGWDGEARITWTDGRAIRLEADGAFRHLIVYTPPGQDFFCVEPVSHMNDAINRMDGVTGHGLRVLAPGETLHGEVTFRLRDTSIRHENDA